MSEYDYNTAYWIKNSFIIVSILTTVITMGLISQRKYLDDMAKYKRTQRYISLLADPFVLRMFLVQACYFIMGIIDITFTPDIGDTQCKVVGALFYWFALVSVKIPRVVSCLLIIFSWPSWYSCWGSKRN